MSWQSVNGWHRRCREVGLRALKSKPRGRPKAPRLKPYQAATIVRLITDRCPDQLKMPFFLWTREAVADLIHRKFGLRLSVWTVGRYLRRWGFTPQKPLRRAYERDPEAVRRWLRILMVLDWSAMEPAVAADRLRRGYARRVLSVFRSG